ncbi:MAG: hypothetical protein AAGH65_05790 [Pseudomonadota bacterium]
MLLSRFSLLAIGLMALANSALAHHEESTFSPLAHSVAHALPWLIGGLALVTLLGFSAWRRHRLRGRNQDRHDQNIDL